MLVAVEALDIDERSEAEVEADFKEDAWLPLGGTSLCRPGTGGGTRRDEGAYTGRDFTDEFLDNTFGGDDALIGVVGFRAGSFGGSCLMVLAMKSHSCVEDKLGLDMLADDMVSNESASSKLDESKSPFRLSKLESPVLFESVVNCCFNGVGGSEERETDWKDDVDEA